MHKPLKDLFSRNNLAEIYEKRIQPKSGRGIDRVSVIDFNKDKTNQFDIIGRKCLTGEYKFSPYLQHLILKSHTKPPRIISIATIRDKLVLSVLNTALQETYPECVNRELPNVKIKSLCAALNELRTKKQGFDLHRIDISAFYDSIDVDRIIGIIKISEMDHNIIKLISKAIVNPTVPNGTSRSNRANFKHDKGIPQGLPISNILAEIYLKDTDSVFSDECIYYNRYADDIIAITEQQVDFESICEDSFREIGLDINSEKSQFCCGQQQINYLGYSIDEDEITVKKKTIERYLQSISMMFVRFRKAVYIDSKREKKKRIGMNEIKSAFLEDLNIKIAGAIFQNKKYGWLQYFSEITDKSILYIIDNFVKDMFRRCPHFKKIPRNLKKASRAYHELKYNWRQTGYIHNYMNAGAREKRRWLTRRGLAPGTFTTDEIDRLYLYHVGRFVDQMERDLGVAYKL